MPQHPHPAPPNDQMTGVLSLLRPHARLILAVILFSTVVNALMLTGPLFTMQVYDRVLSSRSEPTLTALFILVAFLFGAMAVLDAVRGQIMARVGMRVQTALDPRVFTPLHPPHAPPRDTTAPENDIDTLHQFLASSVFFAVIDLPWTPVFLFGIFLFHPWLGLLAVAGGGILFALALANHLATLAVSRNILPTARSAERMNQQYRQDTGTAGALGVRRNLAQRWDSSRSKIRQSALIAADQRHIFGAATRVFRQFLQSAMLALGAWLVLRQEMTAGVMIASSVLMSRALAPLEGIGGQWSFLHSVWHAWRRLVVSGQNIAAHRSTPLPKPPASLHVQPIPAPMITTATPRPVNFALNPGQCLGVIGPTGSGKTRLAQAVTGQRQDDSQVITLGRIPIAHYGDALPNHVGYLPQQMQLMDGTIAENIARMAITPDVCAVLTAAKRVGVHDRILSLSKGYDTWINGDAPALSAGQVQQIGLARAFYGDPALVVLDAPCNNLDRDGLRGLNAALHAAKAAGQSIVITAPRSIALKACDFILVLDRGQQQAFGPKNALLGQPPHDPSQRAATVLYGHRSGAAT